MQPDPQGSAPSTAVRLPWPPLLAASGLGSPSAFTREFGVDAHRWAKNGVTLRAAENVCDAVMVHPAEVWPEYVDIQLDLERLAKKAYHARWYRKNRKRELAKQKARDDAEAEFRRRDRRRRYYANPVKERERINRWRAENRDRVNAYGRAWREKNKDRLNAEARARYAAKRAPCPVIEVEFGAMEEAA